MRRIKADVLANIRIWWRSPTSVFFTIAFPLIFITIFGAIFAEEDQRYTLAYQDQDDSRESRALLDALDATNALILTPIPTDTDARTAARADDHHSTLLIPPGFGAGLRLGKAAELTLITDESRSQSASVSAIVRLTLESFQQANAQPTNSGNQPSQGNQPNQPNPANPAGQPTILIETEPLRPAADGPPRNRYIDFLLPGVIGMTIASNGLIGGLERIASLYETKIMRLIATTPIRKWEWVTAKAFHQVFLAAISAIVVIVVGYLLFDVSIRLNWQMFVLIPAAGIIFAGIALILSRWVQKTDAANTAGSTLLFPMMFLSGTFFPLETMPRWLQYVAQVLPLTYVNDALRAAMITGNRTTLYTDGAIVLVMAALSLLLASRFLQWKEV